MNLIGKIFTVLIFVMSLVFMSLALVVYAGHKNWREEVLGSPTLPGLVKQLEIARADHAKAVKEKEDLQAAKNVEEKAAREQIVKLESEVQDLRQGKKTAEDRLAEKDKAVREYVAAMDAAQQGTKRSESQFQAADKSFHEAEAARLKLFQETVDLREQLDQSVLELKRIKEKDLQLAAEVVHLKDIIRWYGHNASENIKAGPPNVTGHVEALVGNDLLEISIGSDAGLLKGHELIVFRSGPVPVYLGKVKVIRVDPTHAVCHIEDRKGPIQKDDLVGPPVQ